MIILRNFVSTISGAVSICCVDSSCVFFSVLLDAEKNAITFANTSSEKYFDILKCNFNDL